MIDLLRINDTDGVYPPSYYADATPHLDPRPRAEGAIRTDVCIIGAGFTGLSAALHLTQAGFKVTVLEAQRIGFGASGRNGGQVGFGQNKDQIELEDAHGLDTAKRLWQVATDAVQLVKDLSADIPGSGVTPGVIHASHLLRHVPHEHRLVDHMSRVYGHDQMRALGKEEIRHLVNSPRYHGGLIDMSAGHIEPLRYALGLAQKALDAGAEIYEDSHATGIDMSDPAKVTTDQAEVTADHVLIACNGYIGDLNRHVAARVMPINSFIAATEPLGPDRQEEILRNNHAVADSKFVVNYFRFSPDHRLLFGGRESYTYRFFDDIAEAVRRPLRHVFPQLGDVRLDYGWGGTLGITLNRMPYFERLAGNVLVAGGYSGHGVALATMGGKLMAQAVQGQAEQFDLMASLPSAKFPGGDRLRGPLLVLAMLWYSMRDRF